MATLRTHNKRRRRKEITALIQRWLNCCGCPLCITIIKERFGKRGVINAPRAREARANERISTIAAANN